MSRVFAFTTKCNPDDAVRLSVARSSKLALSPREGSERRGVWHMTAYSHVRTGGLPASKREGGRVAVAAVAVPIIIDGSGVDDADARNLGADEWAGASTRFVHLLDQRP